MPLLPARDFLAKSQASTLRLLDAMSCWTCLALHSNTLAWITVISDNNNPDLRTHLDQVEPVPDALMSPEQHPAILDVAEGDGEVALLGQQHHLLHLDQLELKHTVEVTRGHLGSLKRSLIPGRGRSPSQISSSSLS